jgi:hypothetical protein
MGGASADLSEQARLPDAGLAAEENQLASRALAEAGKQPIEGGQLVASSDQPPGPVSLHEQSSSCGDHRSSSTRFIGVSTDTARTLVNPASRATLLSAAGPASDPRGSVPPSIWLTALAVQIMVDTE